LNSFFKGCRNPKEARKNVEFHIEKELIQDKIFYEVCDTSDLHAVREFAKVIARKYPAINILINNGLYDSRVKFY
jgi:short-subunit dehydrogenase involved in D-alanine esterification of teichoic acids